MHVKICGVTTVEDALAVARLGASAIGVNLIAASKRCVDTRTAADIVRAVGSRVEVVAVVADIDEERARALWKETAVRWLQLHGDEDRHLVNRLQAIAYKAVRIGDARDVEVARGMPGSRLLADARVPGQLGGTGQSFDWELVRNLAGSRDIVLAGGLTPGNVAQAIEVVQPWGVDVASGVEADGDPRTKDPGKVAAFIERARRAADV